jgi:hypothetical protein
MKKIQFIAIDEVANQALDIATLLKSSEVLKIDKEKLAQSCVSDFQQIVVVSELDMNVATLLSETFEEANHPIIVYPEQFELSNALKLLLETNISLVSVKIDSLTSVEFSKVIKALETILSDGNENEINADEDDIFSILKPHSINRLYFSQAKNAQLAIMKILNKIKYLNSADGVICQFHIKSDAPLMEISDAMDILDYKTHDEAGILFQTRENKTTNNAESIILVNNHYSFAPMIQKNIDEASTYLLKTAAIVDKFADGTINSEEGNELGEQNGIHLKDLEYLYNLAYSYPNALIKFMKELRDDEISDTTREKLIAQAVIDDYIDIDVLDELILTYKLSENGIIKNIENIQSTQQESEKI